MEVIHHTVCPVCDQGPVAPVFSTKDFTVTGETFSVWRCNNCTSCFTQDVPDAKNIGRYYADEKYISHSDTQEGMVNKVYHKVRKLTLKHKRKIIRRESGMKQGSMLDVGAGTGSFVSEMKHSGWDAFGIETDASARENAKKLHGVDLLPGDAIYTLNKTFDVITLWHVLEHVHDLKGYGRAFKKLLNPGGLLLIAVPNYLSSDAKHYGPNWAAWDVPRHLYHFSPRAMETFLMNSGFKVYKQLPMWFDSFYVSMLSEQYATGKRNLVSACIQGMRSNLKAMGAPHRCSSVIYLARGV